jgi:hypothetical protein
MMSDGFKILDGFPDTVLAVEAAGKVDAQAYETVLIPAIEDKLSALGKIKLLYIIGESFDGFTLGAAWDDTKVGLTHLGDFSKIALVSDVEWIRLGMRAFAPMIPGEMRLFSLAERQQAEDWISA